MDVKDYTIGVYAKNRIDIRNIFGEISTLGPKYLKQRGALLKKMMQIIKFPSMVKPVNYGSHLEVLVNGVKGKTQLEANSFALKILPPQAKTDEKVSSRQICTGFGFVYAIETQQPMKT